MRRAFPLDWPHDQARVPTPAHSAMADRCRLTLTEAAARLEREAKDLDDAVLSLNVPLNVRAIGGYQSEQARGDPSAALRFTFRGKAYHVGQDRYHEARINVWSLALMVEGLRQMSRHAGDAMFERMISGFAALPPPGPAASGQTVPTVSWRTVLGFASDFGTVSGGLMPEQCTMLVRDAYRKRAKEAGGDEGRLLTLNLARDQAMAEIAR